MIDAKTLGRRIKYFRKRAGMSQMDLELAMNASVGMISRIESGKVNPSKETVLYIGKILLLNDREVDYLIGTIAEPASDDEVQKAIEVLRNHYTNNNVYAYMLDDRFRMLYFSKGFEKIFKRLLGDKYRETVSKILGDSVVALLVDDSYMIKKYLQTDKYMEMLYYQLGRVKKQMEFMRDDTWYRRNEKVVEKYPDIKNIWDEVDNNQYNFNSLESREIGLRVECFNIKMSLYREPLWNYPRFESIEYIPNSKFLQVVRRLIS
ncbi:helix-turn-helix transcriptional regulator [Candidatus Dojkabacteria bacterium]|nr:helix-turn-helix transcriptional regulator [Candidatus Dojkabacteria bacterium]